MAETTTATRRTATAPHESLASCTTHREAWRSLAQAHAAVSGRLEEALAGADEERLKMGELAEALVITRGGLTKLVDRLVKAGLIERTFCATDRRVAYATLRPAGAELLAEMYPIVATELDSAFAANITPRQADQLRETLDRVRGTACNGAV
jgi:DNA-binding MarR family transcriptional regulator